MTEQDLRQRVVDAMLGWEGATRGSPKHLEILNIYNLHTPLARGYAVKVGDAWCATTVSAAWITAGVSDWIGTECSCSRLIELAKEHGIWYEDDAIMPEIGDAVLYDWQDGKDYAKTDNRGAPEHIGIVVQTGMDAFTVMEGNMGSSSVCGRRLMGVNGRYIRGFIRPNYAAIAAALTKQDERPVERYNRVKDLPEWAKNDIKSLIDKGIIRGGGEKDADGRPADLDLSLDMIRTIIICKRMNWR